MRYFIIVLMGLLWSQCAVAQQSGAVSQIQHSEPAPPPSSPQSAPMLSQGDPVWKYQRIGASATVGKKGCLAASLYDILVRMGEVNASPSAFINQLISYNFFTRAGALYWKLSSYFAVTAERLMLRGRDALLRTQAELARGAAVLLQVTTARGTQHWVVASGVLGGDIEIRDPDGGRITTLAAQYGLDAVRGMAIITK